MAKWQKLTNSSDETSLGSILSGDSVFTIPYFQRPYKWKPERLTQLQQDILQLVDESADNHFLGAIIIHGRASNPADPRVYEVIDGQQRVTTIFLFLCAVVRTLCKAGEYDEAISLFLKYLVINRQTSLITNSKLQPSKDDRKQLNSVMQDLTTDPIFAAKLGQFIFKPLPAVGGDTGRLLSNYRLILYFLNVQMKQEQITRVRAIYTALLGQISVVQIDVFDPINGPKIFDSLNSRQEPMTTGDLIRNEIFSRVADRPPEEVDSLDEQYWQPFYKKFSVPAGVSLFDVYFFPFGLIKNPNLKKSDVYAHLRGLWKEEKRPDLIIDDLASYQKAFLDLHNRTNTQMLSPSLAMAVKRLAEISPTSTYPFLMQLSKALALQTIEEAAGLGIMMVLESFLVRRAVCGHEPTGLHAVFKGLWADCGGKPNASDVEANIRVHKTVTWPSDGEVRLCIANRPLYGSTITNFLLVEWNRSLGGDVPAVKFWIEHVLPDTISPDWKSDFTEKQHETMKHRLGNLLPLSAPMNQGLGNANYVTKREKYMSDSMFKAARDFATKYETWTPVFLEQRSLDMGEWVIQRWSV